MGNTRIVKNQQGYGYCYTDLAEINKYCEDNGIRYYQEIETCEINQKDYIITYLVIGDKIEKHRGCQIVDAVLSGIHNPVQEYGSSLTYCRRYSLLMALGLATEDDDGASLTQTLTPEEAKNYILDFGKHKGQKVQDIPQQYLQWMLSEDKYKKYHNIITLATGLSIPSEEEQQERLDLINQIMILSQEKDIDIEEVCTKFNVDSISDMTTEQMNKCVVAMNKKGE